VGDEGSVGPEDGDGLTRRQVLRDGSAITFALFVAPAASAFGDVAVRIGEQPAFLSTGEMRALRGLVDRFIPGKPEDSHDGALAAGCAEAIDALLGAFASAPPRIYAGAPFSDRGGSERNHFERFLRLDGYEEKGWRLRIEGSRNRAKLEFNGPHTGWQQIYRRGLRALDEASRGGSFGQLSGLERDLLLRTTSDPAIGGLVDVAFPHTWQFMYGAPEYGGNRDLVGWRYTRWPGDVHPRGYTRAEVEAPGDRGPLGGALDAVDSLLSLDELLALAPFAAPDASHMIAGRGGDSLDALRAELEPVLNWVRDERDGG